MAKPPKKSSTGWKYTALKHDIEGASSFFTVEGPSLGWIHCETLADAETIAASLNLASQQRSITSKALRLANELQDIQTLFKE